MKSMDPSLGEASQVIGAGRWRTMLRVTLPLVAPGVLGAAMFVFAEMLGSFSAALVLGTPSRFYVITTAIYQLVSQYRAAHSAGRGHGRVVVRRHVSHAVSTYRRVTSNRSFVTISGKAPSARAMDVGWLRWVLFTVVCVSYTSLLSVVLPVATLVYASVQRLAVAFPTLDNFTLENYRTALSLNAVRSAVLVEQPAARSLNCDDRCCIGRVVVVDHPAQQAAGVAAYWNIRHVSAGGFRDSRVCVRDDVGVARIPQFRSTARYGSLIATYQAVFLAPGRTHHLRRRSCSWTKERCGSAVR